MVVTGMVVHALAGPIRSGWLLWGFLEILILTQIGQAVLSSKPGLAATTLARVTPASLDGAARSVMFATLALDAANLAVGLAPKVLGGFVLGNLHASLWASLGGAVFFGLTLARGPDFKARGAAVAALSLHLLLTLLGRDDFAFRSQVLCLGFFSVVFGPGLRVRLCAAALATALLAFEGPIMSSGPYALFAGSEWVSPLDDATMTLDMSLKQMIMELSGLWGLGLEMASELDLPDPQAMHLHGLVYLTAAGGLVAAAVFAALDFTLLAAMGWMAVRRLSGWAASLALPTWLMLAFNQTVSLTYHPGFSRYGPSHGPAFIGGGETGLEILLLSLFIVVAPGVSAEERARPSTASSPRSREDNFR
jgi:hypothetical protein